MKTRICDEWQMTMQAAIFFLLVIVASVGIRWFVPSLYAAGRELFAFAFGVVVATRLPIWERRNETSDSDEIPHTSFREREAQISRRAIANRYGNDPRFGVAHEGEITAVTYAYAPGEACSGDARSEWNSKIGIQDNPMSVEFAERDGEKVLIAHFECYRP